MTIRSVLFGVENGRCTDVRQSDIWVPTLVALIAFPACLLILSVLILSNTPKSNDTIAPIAEIMMMFGWTIVVSWIGIIPVYFVGKLAVKRGWIGLIHALVFGAALPAIAVFGFRFYSYLTRINEGFNLPNILGLATISGLVGMAFAFVAWLVFYIRRRDFYRTTPPKSGIST